MKLTFKSKAVQVASPALTLKRGDVVILTKNDTQRPYLVVESTTNPNAVTGYDVIFVNLDTNKVYSTVNKYAGKTIGDLVAYFKFQDDDDIDAIYNASDVEIEVIIAD